MGKSSSPDDTNLIPGTLKERMDSFNLVSDLYPCMLVHAHTNSIDSCNLKHLKCNCMVVAHAQYSGDSGRWISEFKSSLVYRGSSRTARALQRNPVLKKIHKKSKM